MAGGGRRPWPGAGGAINVPRIARLTYELLAGARMQIRRPLAARLWAGGQQSTAAGFYTPALLLFFLSSAAVFVFLSFFSSRVGHGFVSALWVFGIRAGGGLQEAACGCRGIEDGGFEDCVWGVCTENDRLCVAVIDIAENK